MKKWIIFLFAACMLSLTACSSGNKPEEPETPKVDDEPVTEEVQPEEFIVINNDSYEELVKILDGKNLYKPDEFYKGEFTSQIGLAGYQYIWAESSINGKEFKLGDTVYHLTGEVKGHSDRIRFEAEEATFYLAKDTEGYWGLYITDKGTNDPVGLPYAIGEQFTYWHENEAWNSGYVQIKEKIDVEKHDVTGYSIIRATRKFYAGVNKDFYEKVIVSNCAKSTLIFRIDKSYDNYDYIATLSPDYSSVTLEMGDVSQFGPTPKAALYGGTIFPEYHPAANTAPEQYEEDGMIWFLIYTQGAGEFIIQEGREPELSYKFQDAEYKVDVYTNHLFLPKDYK
ncbi:MAG: hypothetical protein IKE59_07110 [Erysipelotrichaceae bacterium]|nr:hypothetical protein [Erysipelotrichaceae bacterium]